MQFYAIKHFAEHYPIDVLPLALEDIPDFLPVFDTVFSMGVLYHRPSPMDHLRQLKSLLRPNGQLVLETLVIEDEVGSQFGKVLVPEKRYAMMNNVWFIPTPTTLCAWLTKCGYSNPRVVDINVTSVEEQRVTDWMQFHSLKNFLDPNDSSLTIEGYPAPRRAIILAENV
jgi:tRNA (mo5U34)-methyltransferase